MEPPDNAACSSEMYVAMRIEYLSCVHFQWGLSFIVNSLLCTHAATRWWCSSVGSVILIRDQSSLSYELKLMVYSLQWLDIWTSQWLLPVLTWTREMYVFCYAAIAESSTIVIRVHLTAWANSKLMDSIYISPIVARMMVQRGIQWTHKIRFSFWTTLLIVWVGVAVPLHQEGKPPLLLGSVSSSVERGVAALTHSSHKLKYFRAWKVVIRLILYF